MKGQMNIIALIGLVLLVVAIVGVLLLTSGLNGAMIGDKNSVGNVTAGLGLIISVALIIAVFAAFGIKLNVGS